MAELLTRLQHEKRFERLLRAMSKEHAAELAEYLKTAKSIDDIPEEFWERVEKDIADDGDEKALVLLLMFEESARQHLLYPKSTDENPMPHRKPVEQSDITAAGDAYVRNRLKEIAKPYVRHSKDIIETQIREMKNHGGPTRNRIRDAVGKVFGRSRAKTVADTETNLAMIDGANTAVDKAGINVTRVWAHSSLRPPRHANAPEQKCVKCSPFEGKAEQDWKGNEPGSIHPNCDCFPLFIDEYGNEIGNDEHYTDTLERFGDRLPKGFLKSREQLFRDRPELLGESLVESEGAVSSESGHWITLKPHGDEEDGYVHVMINGDGHIVAGPKALEGKHIGHLHESHKIVSPEEYKKNVGNLDEFQNGHYSAKTPEKSIGELRKEFKQKREELEARFEEDKKRIGRENARTSSKTKRESLQKEWESIKENRDRDSKELNDKYMKLITEHPEYTTEQNASREHTLKLRDDAAKREKEHNEQRDAEDWKRIQGAGGHEKVLADLNANLRHREGVLRRTKETNQLGPQSNIDRVKRNIARTEELAKKFSNDNNKNPPGEGGERDGREDIRHDAAYPWHTMPKKEFEDYSELNGNPLLRKAHRDADEYRKITLDKIRSKYGKNNDHLLQAEAEKYQMPDDRTYWDVIQAGENAGPRTHREAVERAIKEGKYVPKEVLSDYPDLSPKGDAASSVKTATPKPSRATQ